MTNYQWLNAVVDKYAAAYLERDIVLGPTERETAARAIQSRTQNCIDDILVQVFTVYDNIPQDATQTARSIARRVENAVLNYVYFRDNGFKEGSPTYADALVVYLLHSHIEGVSRYKGIHFRNLVGRRRGHYSLGKVSVAALGTYLTEKGILKPAN